MHQRRSLRAAAQAKGADNWIRVFQQRDVWHLTREIVERWVARNSIFFEMIQQLAPHGSKLLELGCGPGRHGLGAATLGYDVVGIDIDPQIIIQAQINAQMVAPVGATAFRVGDMYKLDGLATLGTFRAITHGGVMEHLESVSSIREALRAQLRFAPAVIFDVPIDSPKNRQLFARDDIFRQMWTPNEWVENVLSGLPIVETRIDLHPEENMTDDLVVGLRA